MRHDPAGAGAGSGAGGGVRRADYRPPELGAALGAAGSLAVAAGLMIHAFFEGLPLAAGVCIYVAASDLIPEINQQPGVRLALLVALPTLVRA